MSGYLLPQYLGKYQMLRVGFDHVLFGFQSLLTPPKKEEIEKISQGRLM